VEFPILSKKCLNLKWLFFHSIDLGIDIFRFGKHPNSVLESWRAVVFHFEWVVIIQPHFSL
jgi:hypothetical protein